MTTDVPKKSRSWLPLLMSLVFLAVGAIGMLAVVKVAPELDFFDNSTEERDSRIMQSITREQQVVLLSLGIQGIADKSEKTTFLGLDIPGSERATFLQYSFNAKLGIEGADVSIEQVGDNSFRVGIPEFIFIGHDDPNFRLVAQDNGALSFLTPETDTLEMVNSILNDEARDKYIGANEEILRDQAEEFYGGIIRGIDPTIVLSFDFGQAS